MLKDEKFHMVKGQVSPGQIRNLGNYMILKITEGLILTWDKKTSVCIKLSPKFKVNIHTTNNKSHRLFTDIWFQKTTTDQLKCIDYKHSQF